MSGLALGVELDGDGAHPATLGAPAPARVIAERVQLAERAGFAFATFDDSPLPPASGAARVDAVQRAAFAAPLTSAIGLVPVVHTTYSEPFHVATQLASLDFAAGGRAGWLAAADPSEAAARFYGRTPADAAPAADAIEVARRLWDSWEDDAVIRDLPTGRYFDRDRIHYADFVGDHYSVKGPSIVPRPPQGQLPVFTADGAVAETAEVDAVLFDVAGEDPAEIAAASADRRPTAALALLDLEVALDHAGEPAATRVARLDAENPWLSRHARYTGTAAGLVELLAALATVVDGVRLHPAVLDVDLQELQLAVLPALRRRAALATPLPGGTLRETLGLAAAPNRYASAATASTASATRTLESA